MSVSTNTIHFALRYQESLDRLEKHFLDHQTAIEDWFESQWKKTPPPFYTSVDLRNSGFKIAPVDTNLFPAGFNNLNPQHHPMAVKAVQDTIAEICKDVTQLLIIPESHSRNVFYFESLATLCRILKTAGFEVRLASLNKSHTRPFKHQLQSGEELWIEPIIRQNDQIGVQGFFPGCVILNNDLSGSVPDILKNLRQNIMPSPQLGWSTRLKSGHFQTYSEVSDDFSKTISIDPWWITPLFDQCPNVDFLKKGGEECLIPRTQKLIEHIENKYQEYGVRESPFLAIKADAGTYGMAVMTLQDPDELRQLNRKQRTRMSRSKGGIPVTKVIIQEGIYTYETVGDEQAVAEPVVYLFGKHVIGGFYRVHKNRGPNENLNAPGMNFVPLVFDSCCDAPIPHESIFNNRFYVYGVIARLATLAAARELSALKGIKP